MHGPQKLGTSALICSLASQVANGRLPGFRTNAGKLWMPVLRRWLTLRECFASMGLPTYPALATASGTRLYIPQGTPSTMKRQLGNVMHVHTVGLIMAATLASAAPVDPR